MSGREGLAPAGVDNSGGGRRDGQNGRGRGDAGSTAAFHGARPQRARPIPPKLYRMGEVVEYSGLSRQTIHNYTTMGLLRESHWTRGGHRLFDELVFTRLDEIAHLKRDNKSMREIREHFFRIDGS